MRLLGTLTATAALTAGLVVGSADAAHAGSTIQGCITNWGDNYGSALCGNGPGSRFSVGVKCLMPGNVYYWNRSGWYRFSDITRYAYCNSGHVAKGANVWFSG